MFIEYLQIFLRNQGDDGEAGDPGPVGEPGIAVSHISCILAYVFL